MIGILPLCFFAILCVILLKISGDFSPKFKVFLGCGAGIVFFSLFAKWASPVFHYLKNLTEGIAMGDWFALLFKGLGIAILVSVSTGICRDLGEESVAGQLELCGKGVILSLSLPVMKKIMEFVGEMIH